MSEKHPVPIAGTEAETRAALLDLNNRHARETSHLTEDAWHRMIDEAFSATCFPDAGGLLVAFDQNADYDSPNFLWMRANRDRFVYVDRIIVSADYRGGGRARILYEDLFDRARAAGHDRIVCEVNRVPPNPGSDAFHDRLGFDEIGRADLDAGRKTVRYLERLL